ncbi:MAG: hypothetical protein VXW65_12745 [Pseudomonadota bacterium]|nr:hypothetical protein [Pseudomonadota bacterium]
MTSRFSQALLLTLPVLLAGCETDGTTTNQPQLPSGLFFGFYKEDRSNIDSNVEKIGSFYAGIPNTNDDLNMHMSFQYDPNCQAINLLTLKGIRSNQLVATGSAKFDRAIVPDTSNSTTISITGDYTSNPQLSSGGYYGGVYGRTDRQPSQPNQQRGYDNLNCSGGYNISRQGVWFLFAEGTRHPANFDINIQANTNQVLWSLPLLGDNKAAQHALISVYDRNQLRSNSTTEKALVHQIFVPATPAAARLPTDLDQSERDYVVTVQLFDSQLNWGAIAQTNARF